MVPRGLTRAPHPTWRTAIHRRKLAATLTVAALALAACGPDDEPDDAVDVETSADDSDDDAEADEADETDAADPEEDEGTGSGDDAPEDSEDADVPPLEGEASTEEREETGEGPMISVTDVRTASHDGFDRVVFEIGGEGQAGWGVLYQDEARTQGRGDEVELEGDAVLHVGIRNVAMPFDAPEDVEAYDGPERFEGDGAILEVVEDTIFEGQYVFFLGLDEERPFRIERLDDPQRVVIDIVTEE